MTDLEPPATIQELRMRMRQLHVKSGSPTAAAMRKSIKDFDVPRLAPASLSEFFSNKRPNALPKQDFLRGFVAACLLLDGTAPEVVAAELRTWDAWWTALVLASGTPPVTVTPRIAATPELNIPPRPRPILIIAGFVLGVALGAGGTLAIPRLFRTSETHPRILRMAVDRPRPNGPTAAGCPIQYAAIRDSHGVTLGALWLRECFDRIETVVADTLADRYCINSVILWSNNTRTSTSKTCTPDGFAADLVPITDPALDFTLELVAFEREPG